jgi:hypothetical protein
VEALEVAAALEGAVVAEVELAEAVVAAVAAKFETTEFRCPPQNWTRRAQISELLSVELSFAITLAQQRLQARAGFRLHPFIRLLPGRPARRWARGLDLRAISQTALCTPIGGPHQSWVLKIRLA